MTRFLLAIAALAVPTVPLLALGGPLGFGKAAQPVIIGDDHPILLKRMVVKARALPGG